MSDAITEGVRVRVKTHYLQEQSTPSAGRYVFAYTIDIENEGDVSAQLLERHWVITHGDGHVEEVKGPGVVGQQPKLKPGGSHQYTSGCVLRTPHGTMHGSYQMVREDGTRFDADIAPFSLSAPYALN